MRGKFIQKKAQWYWYCGQNGAKMGVSEAPWGFLVFAHKHDPLPAGKKQKGEIDVKKIISIALALLMVAVMLPVMAMAEGATVVKTKDELTAAVAKGGEVTLGDNITASITIPAGTTVTLNLGAFTLTGDGDHTITNNGTLTVVGSGKVENTDGGKAALFNNVNAKANLNGGTFEGTTWYVIKNLGTITMNGASVDQKDAGSSAIDNGWYGNPGNDCNVTHPGNGYTAKLTIANGNFSGGMNTVKNDDYGVLEISGGTFSNTNGPTVLNWNVATISGGEFKVNSTATSVIANGSFNNEADKGQLTITGGQFTSSDNGNGNLLGYGVGGEKGGSVTISGGKFTGKMVAEGYPYEPVISGGTFSDQENAKKYLDNDNLVVNPATGKVEPKSITIIVPSEGGSTTTTPSTDNTKNPSTGANDLVGVAAALAVVSLLGAAAVIRKK